MLRKYLLTLAFMAAFLVGPQPPYAFAHDVGPKCCHSKCCKVGAACCHHHHHHHHHHS